MKTSLLLSLLACAAIACGGTTTGTGTNDQEPTTPRGGSDSNTGASSGSGAITWCSTTLAREGVVAGTNLDYPSTPSTTWFNTSLDEIVLSSIDEQIMKEAGLSPTDQADVARYKYLAHGFDLRVILGDTPSPGNWFSKSDLSVYLFDVADTATQPDVAIEIFDASAVRDARLTGDRSQLASALRTTIDAMKAKPGPKAVVAFAPDRNPESSVERAFINLFARDVYFATKGSVTVSNLRDSAGARIAAPVYPLRNLRTLDVSATGDLAATPFTAKASCLDVRTSG